ncbi:MAG: hypothetical protein P1V13_22115 [Rhizobiaceae bacterium]|nr:hypothetical protein [Rhizobiaceae bacterium]
MPQTLAHALALALFSVGAPAFVSSFLVSAAGTALFSLAIGVGINLAIRAVAGNNSRGAEPAQTQDVQANIRQEIVARRRIYYRTLVGSAVVFAARRGEKSYLLHYIGEGPLEQFVSFRLDRRPVTLDSSGFVTNDQYRHGGRSRVQILTKTGTMTDEPFDELIAAFPELDHTSMASDIYGKPFRHRGCAMVLQIVEQVPAEKLQDVYPNNMPGLQCLVDGLSEIYDPRIDDTAFTGNAALCLLAEIMDVYGLTSSDTDDVDFDAFGDFADHCEESVTLLAGGSEERYRAAGVVTLDLENEARIRKLADVCNAEVFFDRQGRITVRQKLRATPAIALRAKNGDHLALDIEGGRTEQKKFNTVKVHYVDASLNYKANELVWSKADWVAEDGDEPEPLNVIMCPSPTQALRLAKLHLYFNNPLYAGQVTSGPQALDLMEDNCFTLDLTPEDDFTWVANATGDINYDGERMAVTSSFVVFDEGATDWTPATDEQDQVIVPPVLLSDVDDIALDVTPTVELLENSAPVLKFTWEGDSVTLPDSYYHDVQVSDAGAATWFAASVNQDEDSAQYGPVADTAAYDWRIRNLANGKTFDWQESSSPVTVTVDLTEPEDLLTAGASSGTGQYTVAFSTENDAHLKSVAIYQVASGGTLVRGTDRVARPSVAPGVSYSIPISAAADDYDIYFEPMNISSVPGTLEGPFAVTVS